LKDNFPISWSEAMQEYQRSVTITNQGPPSRATLKVIRLPGSWYGVIWESRDRYLSISQDKTEVNGGHEHMRDEEFLSRVQFVAGFRFGVEFEFEE
jgi:hypothetical protein